MCCRRVSNSAAYTLECNGRLGRAVMEAELAGQPPQHSAQPPGAAGPGAGAGNGAGMLDSEGGAAAAGRPGGRVLIGHSLGAACVAAEAIGNPEVG